VEVRAGLDMHGHPIRAGIDKIMDVPIWIGNHEMDVNRQSGDGPHRPYHQRSNGYIGHKMPIHDIHMDDIGSCRFDGPDLLAQP
jgi:hypothetical protein